MSAAREIAVSKVVLTIGKKEIVLTPDEARTLRAELDMLLGGAYNYTYTGPWIYPMNPQPVVPQITWICNTPNTTY